MEIYIARHAESFGNLEKSYFPDSGLTDTGVLQAKTLAENLSGSGIKTIFSSDARRAIETSNIVAAKLGLKTSILPGIHEYERPTGLMGKTISDETSQTFEKERTLNYLNPEWKFSDDESFNELKERGLLAIEKLKLTPENEKILMVSHGTFIKLLLALMIFGQDLDVKTFWEFRHRVTIKNTGVSVCSYGKDSGWKIHSFGSIS